MQKKVKRLLLIICCLIFVACKQNNSTKTLFTENFKYSGYYWHFNQQSDSFEFYLVHYIDIDKDGKFVLMRHDNWRSKPKYFTGYINDTIKQFIDTTFYNDNFKTDYSWNPEKPVVYDGFIYCFDYAIKNNSRKQIQFIPPYSPNQIVKLSSLLDTLVYNTVTKKIDTLNISNYSEKMKQLLLSVSPLPWPPKPPKVTIEFKPPKFSK